jgi:hypothetical protein
MLFLLRLCFGTSLFSVPFSLLIASTFFVRNSFMCCSLEWWSYELIILLSGLLPNPQLETSVLSVWYSSLHLTNSRHNHEFAKT